MLVEIYCWLFRCLWPMGWKTQNKTVTSINKAVTYKSHLCTHLGLPTLCSKRRPQLWLPVLGDVPPFTGPLAGLGYPVLERSGQAFLCVSFIFLPRLSFPFTCASCTMIYSSWGCNAKSKLYYLKSATSAMLLEGVAWITTTIQSQMDEQLMALIPPSGEDKMSSHFSDAQLLLNNLFFSMFPLFTSLLTGHSILKCQRLVR